MAQPGPCPGSCVFCPTYDEAPKSYTPESPAVLRAIASKFDPYEQTELRLKILKKMGHPDDKIEMIIMGGTFLACPEEYQYSFIKSCYDALNGHIATNLDEAKEVERDVRSQVRRPLHRDTSRLVRRKGNKKDARFRHNPR